MWGITPRAADGVGLHEAGDGARGRLVLVAHGVMDARAELRLGEEGFPRVAQDDNVGLKPEGGLGDAQSVHEEGPLGPVEGHVLRAPVVGRQAGVGESECLVARADHAAAVLVFEAVADRDDAAHEAVEVAHTRKLLAPKLHVAAGARGVCVTRVAHAHSLARAHTEECCCVRGW